MAGVHKEKATSKAKTEPETQEEKAVDLTNEELTEGTDDLLDEIDSVLEENAAQFVADYVQKGGE